MGNSYWGYFLGILIMKYITFSWAGKSKSEVLTSLLAQLNPEINVLCQRWILKWALIIDMNSIIINCLKRVSHVFIMRLCLAVQSPFLLWLTRNMIAQHEMPTTCEFRNDLPISLSLFSLWTHLPIRAC